MKFVFVEERAVSRILLTWIQLHVSATARYMVYVPKELPSLPPSDKVNIVWYNITTNSLLVFSHCEQLTLPLS